MTDQVQRDRTTVKVGAAGRIVLPAGFREAEDIQVGDDLVAYIVDGELRVMTRRRAWEAAQRLVASHVPRERSLVDEVIAERRAESARE